LQEGALTKWNFILVLTSADSHVSLVGSGSLFFIMSMTLAVSLKGNEYHRHLLNRSTEPAKDYLPNVSSKLNRLKLTQKSFGVCIVKLFTAVIDVVTL
jgi:hypothetical protein